MTGKLLYLRLEIRCLSVFSFQGSTEPSTLPAMLGSSLSVLVPVMCRTLELTASHTHDIEVRVNILIKMQPRH